MPYRILFVCMGNICRSPAAEAVMRSQIQGAGMARQIECDSAGTIRDHEGSPPDPRMQGAATARGVPLKGSARQIHSEDFRDFDLILTMDDGNHWDVMGLALRASHAAKVRPFCQFVTRFSDREVPDPYYGGPEGFEHVLDLLEDGCARLLDHVLRESFS